MTQQSLPMTEQAAPTSNTPADLFRAGLNAPDVQRAIGDALAEKKDSFIANLISMAANSPLIARCEPRSVAFAALKAAMLKLPLDQSLGYAYVVPYGTQAQFQLGWRGFVQLALRGGQITKINVRDVRQGEITGEDYLSGDLFFSSLPVETRANAPIVGYVAFFEQNYTFRKSLFMSVAEINQHAAKFSKTYANPQGIWAKNFDAMAKKTVIKLLLSRWATLSAELQAAVQADQAVIVGTDGADLEYVDSPNGGVKRKSEIIMAAEKSAAKNAAVMA